VSTVGKGRRENCVTSLGIYLLVVSFNPKWGSKVICNYSASAA